MDSSRWQGLSKPSIGTLQTVRSRGTPVAAVIARMRFSM